MKKELTLKEKAIMKVIACIDSSKNYEHLHGCKRMIQFLYNYNIKNTTLSYVMLKYRAKKAEIYDG